MRLHHLNRHVQNDVARSESVGKEDANILPASEMESGDPHRPGGWPALGRTMKLQKRTQHMGRGPKRRSSHQSEDCDTKSNSGDPYRSKEFSAAGAVLAMDTCAVPMGAPFVDAFRKERDHISIGATRRGGFYPVSASLQTRTCGTHGALWCRHA